MTMRGHIKDGAVVLDRPAPLPDGTAVTVLAEAAPSAGDAEAAAAVATTLPTLYDRLKDVIGKAEGLPSDMAENHDHYIHGAPKGVDRP